MMNEMMPIAIRSLLFVLCLLYLVFWRYRIYKLDLFRQDIFDLRDALFDNARGGLISFDHPAYGMLREFMNGFIRFGHQLSLWQMLIFLFMAQKKDFDIGPSFEERWNEVTKDLTPTVKEQLDSYLFKVHSAVFKHLVATAPVLIVMVIPPLLLLLFMNRILDRLKNFINPPMDSAALSIGQA
jgi:hypothetical protein